MKASFSKSIANCTLQGLNSKLLGHLQVRSLSTILALSHFMYQSSYVSFIEFMGSSAPRVSIMAGLHELDYTANGRSQHLGNFFDFPRA